MNTPVTPNAPSMPSPTALKKSLDAIRKRETERIHQKLKELAEAEMAGTISEERQLEVANKAMSMNAKRKRASNLKKKGLSITEILSNTEISDVMSLPESAIRNLLKPYEPKPHLTQRIEGLETVRSELSKNDHPAGRGRQRNGGK